MAHPEDAAATARLRRAVADHPAEPYFMYLGARLALGHKASVIPWVNATLERAPVYPPVHLLLARSLRNASPSQARVEYRLLHYASRALYGQLLGAGVAIAEYHRSFLHAKVAVIDDRWATVGSSNIDPYSLLMAREANVFVRDPHFADQLRLELLAMIETGTRYVAPQRWATRNVIAKAACWIAYGLVRVGMGVLGYGGNEFFPRRRRRAIALADREGPGT